MREHSNWGPSPQSPPKGRGSRKISGLDEDAGVAGQTAFSGSQIKPPALPEVMTSRQEMAAITNTARQNFLKAEAPVLISARGMISK